MKRKRIARAALALGIALWLGSSLNAQVIWGYVTDPDGAPLPAKITIKTPVGLRPGLNSSDDVTVTTDEDGRYLIRPLRPGPKILFARAFNHGFEFREVQLDGRLNRIDFQLPTAASISGTIVDSEGFAAPDCTIRIAYMDPELAAVIGKFGLFQGWMFGEVETDEEGRFSLPNMVQPDTPIQIEVCDGPAVTASYPAKLEPGSNLEDLVLLRGAKPAALTVRVVDEDGLPVPGARLMLLAVGRPVTADFSRARDLSARRYGQTDENGEAHFEAVAEGERKLVVTHPRFRGHRRDLYVGSLSLEQQVLVLLEKDRPTSRP